MSKVDLKVWGPILLIVAVVVLAFSFRSATADPAVPNAPVQAGANPGYYTGDEVAAAKAKGESLPDPPSSP
ncbi:hypothetical protein BH11ARM2_BH11ARM2_13380 [soil metagenome]